MRRQARRRLGWKTTGNKRPTKDASHSYIAIPCEIFVRTSQVRNFRECDECERKQTCACVRQDAYRSSWVLCWNDVENTASRGSAQKGLLVYCFCSFVAFTQFLRNPTIFKVFEHFRAQQQHLFWLKCSEFLSQQDCALAMPLVACVSSGSRIEGSNSEGRPPIHNSLTCQKGSWNVVPEAPGIFGVGLVPPECIVLSFVTSDRMSFDVLMTSCANSCLELHANTAVPYPPPDSLGSAPRCSVVRVNPEIVLLQFLSLGKSKQKWRSLNTQKHTRTVLTMTLLTDSATLSPFSVCEFFQTLFCLTSEAVRSGSTSISRRVFLNEIPWRSTCCWRQFDF